MKRSSTPALVAALGCLFALPFAGAQNLPASMAMPNSVSMEDLPLELHFADAPACFVFPELPRHEGMETIAFSFPIPGPLAPSIDFRDRTPEPEPQASAPAVQPAPSPPFAAMFGVLGLVCLARRRH